MHRIILTLLALAPITACAELPGTKGPDVTEPDACHASGWQHLVGQNQNVLAATTFPAPMRVVRPGMAMTMDYAPHRLNVAVDRNGKISSVYCG